MHERQNQKRRDTSAEEEEEEYKKKDPYRLPRLSGWRRWEGYPQERSGNCRSTSRFWRKGKTRSKWRSTTRCKGWRCLRWRQGEALRRQAARPAWESWRRAFCTLSSRFLSLLYLLPFPLPSLSRSQHKQSSFPSQPAFVLRFRCCTIRAPETVFFEEDLSTNWLKRARRVQGRSMSSLKLQLF